MASPSRLPLQPVGWREVVALPDLTANHIRAKIDTGARTSSLHALEIERFERDGARWIRFLLDLDDGAAPARCELQRVDRRRITSSNGEYEERPIVRTRLVIGALAYDAEFSLTDRSQMKFPLLIGRAALKRRFVVDSGRSWLQSPPERTKGTRA